MISEAADRAFGAYRQGRVVEEPQITDRILGAIEERIRSQPVRPYEVEDVADELWTAVRTIGGPEDRIRRPAFGGIVWKARTLRTGPGVAGEEKRHGADLMGVLDLDLPGYRATKGFLAQAKRAEPGRRFDGRDWDRLCSQCATMLDRTPASFVLVYSLSKGIRFIPANSILGPESRDMFDLYDCGVSSFFERHIASYVGDPRLNSTDIRTLDALAELPVERVFELSARPSE